MGDADVGAAFDPVGVVAGAFDDSRAGPHPRFGVEVPPVARTPEVRSLDGV